MGKINCWEYKECGREAGGHRARELGECPAAVCEKTNGINEGTMGGRVCWAISGTLCGGEVQGFFATKVDSCLDCDFFKRVLEEQGPALARLSEIMQAMQK